MLENEPTGGERAGTDVPPGDAAASTTPTRRTRAPRRKATPPPAGTEPAAAADPAAPAPAEPATSAEPAVSAEPGAAIEAGAAQDAPAEAPAAPARRRRKAAAPAAAPPVSAEDPAAVAESLLSDAEPAVAPVKAVRARRTKATRAAAPAAVQPELVPPDPADDAQPDPVQPEPERADPVQAEFAPVEPEQVEAARTVPDVGTTAPVIGVLPLDDEPVIEDTPPARGRRRAAAMPPPVLFMPPEPEPDLAPPAARRGRRVPPVEAIVAPTEPSSEPAEDLTADEPAEPSRRRRRPRRGAEEPVEAVVETAPPVFEETGEPAEDVDDVEDGAEGELDDDDDSAAGRRRRRRGRRGRGRGKGPSDDDEDDGDTPVDAEAEAEGEAETESEGETDDEGDEPEEVDGVTRRRRRRRRKGSGDAEPVTASDDGVHTVVRIREPRTRERSDEVQGVSGSTRLEAKRQRRRDGREQRRTRPPILSESEFLARREAVDRVMVVRQKSDRTQIAVLEDGVLVEHYVARATSGTMVGNVYLGKVQNVLPSMEAAFVDVGRGRNAVLYAGEVNWDATGLEGRARSIEQALRSGDSVLVQVTKDPMGHKGARLSSHIALSGRHLVYVPNGNASGISRKLPDNERKRLRDILKKMVPDGAGVIVRTAAEGATEDELARDVKRLQAQWEDIQVRAADGHAPAPLSEEPDLVIRVVRDLFNEDFRELVVQGEQAYGEVENYLDSVSPDLLERLHRHTGAGDVFAEKRIDEQILKGLDRKVFLPSGGHLVIDRTEAMTVVDVNTGKYTGAGGNLEETVTRNNLEAAEEIVRQLRLRDLGGIVVIDFIDMVLESNRDLVLRRLTECLGRDRTKHQVTEITSLGLVQMTRKRIGAGLLEAFSETCDHCKGRGLMIHTEPVPEKRSAGAGTQVRAVAAAPARTEQPVEKAPAGRQRRRRGGADPAEAPERIEATDPTDPVAGDRTGPDVDETVLEIRPEAVPEIRPETGPAAVAAGLPPRSSGVVAPAARTAAADDGDEYDITGYDLSRYESDDDTVAPLEVEDTEPLRLTGADDPDAADEEEDDEDEPVGAGTGARRRSRRGGTRRRTRP